VALRLITGVPGSGKSYFAVHHLVNHYYTLNEGVYVAKPGVTVITNIEEFKPAHLSLSEVLSLCKVPYQKFFTVDYQKKVCEKHGQVVYLVDEAQRFFDEYFRDKDVIYFFEYHRHLGIDIYLMTQNAARVSRAIRDLCEYEMRAARRMTSLRGEFKYKQIVVGEVADTKILKRDKSLFALYTSMSRGENEKIKNPMKKMVLLALGVIALGIGAFYYTFFTSSMSTRKVSSPGAPSAHAVVASPSASPVASVAPVKSTGKFRRWSWLAVGESLFYPDPVSGELVVCGTAGRRFRLVGNDYRKFYLWVTDDEVTAYEKRGVPLIEGGPPASTPPVPAKKPPLN